MLGELVKEIFLWLHETCGILIKLSKVTFLTTEVSECSVIGLCKQSEYAWYSHCIKVTYRVSVCSYFKHFCIQRCITLCADFMLLIWTFYTFPFLILLTTPNGQAKTISVKGRGRGRVEEWVHGYRWYGPSASARKGEKLPM